MYLGLNASLWLVCLLVRHHEQSEPSQHYKVILETCDLWDINQTDFWKIFWFLDNPRTCDIWNTDYNSDNWEPEFMTIFVIQQLIVTLDSIRNFCDVSHALSKNLHWSKIAQTDRHVFCNSAFEEGYRESFVCEPFGLGDLCRILSGGGPQSLF